MKKLISVIVSFVFVFCTLFVLNPTICFKSNGLCLFGYE